MFREGVWGYLSPEMALSERILKKGSPKLRPKMREGHRLDWVKLTWRAPFRKERTRPRGLIEPQD